YLDYFLDSYVQYLDRLAGSPDLFASSSSPCCCMDPSIMEHKEKCVQNGISHRSSPTTHEYQSVSDFGPPLLHYPLLQSLRVHPNLSAIETKCQKYTYSTLFNDSTRMCARIKEK